MARVIRTVDVVYGSYSGTVKVLGDSDDDLEIVKAQVKRQENLNFLAMATYSCKIIDTQYLNEVAHYEEN